VSSSAFDAAVRLLKGRAKSRARLEQALLARGHAEREVAEALGRVTALGYLNDARYAEARARSAIAQGRSLADVQRRLEADGISTQEAAAAARAAAAEAGHDELAAARALVKKRRLAGPKAARFLAGRGFSADVIERVAGNALEDYS
jgi:regulatory protein